MQIAGANVKNASQLAGFNELVSERDSRSAAIVEPDKRRQTFFFCQFRHLTSVGKSAGNRLFASDRFACFQSGNGGRHVHEVRGYDIDKTDFRVGDGRLPVGGRILPAPSFGKAFDVFSGQTSYGVHYRINRRIAITVDLSPRVGVRASHKSLSDKSYVNFSHEILLSKKVFG